MFVDLVQGPPPGQLTARRGVEVGVESRDPLLQLGFVGGCDCGLECACEFEV